MLYDPKWDADLPLSKPAHEPLSVEGLIAWLERQPASTVYCYESNGACLLANYLRDAHGWDPGVGAFTVRNKAATGQRLELPYVLNAISVGCPRTYGGALKRARAAVAP